MLKRWPFLRRKFRNETFHRSGNEKKSAACFPPRKLPFLVREPKATGTKASRQARRPPGFSLQTVASTDSDFESAGLTFTVITASEESLS